MLATVGPKSTSLLKKNISLQTQCNELQKELDQLRKQRNSLQESFSQESQASEEQRVIIQLLKAALDKKAQAIGMEGQVRNHGENPLHSWNPLRFLRKCNGFSIVGSIFTC